MLEVDTTVNIPRWLYCQNLKELTNMILWYRLFLKRGKPVMEVLRYISPCFKTWTSWSFKFAAFLVKDILTEILYLWRVRGDSISLQIVTIFHFAIYFFTPLLKVYHYTCFWNLLWELSVKLIVCSDSLSLSFMPDYLPKLNQKWSPRFSSLLHLLQSWPSTSYLRLKRILDLLVVAKNCLKLHDIALLYWRP